MQILLKRLIYALMNGTGGSGGNTLKESARMAPLLQRQYTEMMADVAIYEDRFCKRCGVLLHDYIAYASGASSVSDILRFVMEKRMLDLELLEDIPLENILRVIPLDLVLLCLNLLGLWYYTKVSKNNDWMRLFKTYCEKLYDGESRMALERIGDAMIKRTLGRIHELV